MNERGELQVSEGGSTHLMSESSLKRLKQAEGTLLIGDGTPKWLLNVATTVTGSPTAVEQTFNAIVYTVMYEAGFYFIDGPQNNSFSFDLRLMHELNNSSALLKNVKKVDSQYVAMFSHRLIHPSTIKVISYFVPDSKDEYFCVINFLWTNHRKEADSFLFPVKSSTVFKNLTERNIEFDLLGCKNLSLKLKNSLYSLKSRFDCEIYHSSHILSLPPHILQLLCKFLDATSFVNFSMSCKYLYENFSEDETIWKYHSVVGFCGLRKLPNETWKTHFKYQTGKRQYSYSKFSNVIFI